MVTVIRSHTKTLFFYTCFDPIPEENHGETSSIYVKSQEGSQIVDLARYHNLRLYKLYNPDHLADNCL